MRHLVMLVGVLMIAISVLGIATPERLVAVVSGWPTDTRFYVAVGTRLALGLIFILAAPRCRLPAVIKVVGVMAMAAALVLLFLGGARVDTLFQWWSHRPLRFIRSWCALGALVGALILYSARPRRSTP